MDDLATRDRLEQLERRHAEEIARANAALAAAQDRSYWLERWQLDLNALMRRRGASELRAALRAARAVYRKLYDTRTRLTNAVARAPGGLARARRVVQQEREVGRPATGGADAARRALEAAGVQPQAHDVWIHLQAGSQLDDLPATGRVVLVVDGVEPGSVLARCTPDWSVTLYLAGDPDVYLLERR